MYQKQKVKRVPPHYFETPETASLRSKQLQRKYKIDSLDRKSLMRELDKWFSLFVRLRDRKCVLTGLQVEKDGYKMAETCGHLFPRGNMMTRFDEKLCFGLSVIKNGENEDDQREEHEHELNQWFIRKYGVDIYDHAKVQSSMIFKLPTYRVDELIQEYKEKYQKLLDKV